MHLISPSKLALASLLLMALAVRLYGLDWDDGHHLHPDELFITHWILGERIHLVWPPDLSNLLDPARSGLNPRSVDPTTGAFRDDYAYGALPLLVTEAIAGVVSRLTGSNWHAPERVYLIGRALSALLDTMTVLVVFLIGRRIASVRVGMLAATVAALAPMSIQLAHFFTTDSWLTCFVSLGLLWMIHAVDDGRLRWFVASGAAVGLAMATKGSAFALAGLVAIAIAYSATDRLRGQDPIVSIVTDAARRAFAAAFAALVCFAIFEPYALVRPDVYLRALGRQADIIRGAFDVPYTRIYVGTPPVLYQVEHLIKWGLGPFAGLLALAGLGCLAAQIWRQRSPAAMLAMAWLLAYGLVVALPEAKFLRYGEPLIPVLAVSAGLALDGTWRTIERRYGRPLATAVGTVLIGGIAVWTMAFLSIYAREHPRLLASQWIYANVPAGSTLGAEYWDDALPKPLAPGLTPWDYQYAIANFDYYADRPPEEVADAIYQHLQQVDCLVLSSNRVSSSVRRLPWRYPVQIRFYDLLTSGQLGFSLAAEFASYPGIGPFAFPDQDADESFINYDHPRVLIYGKDSP